MPRPPIHPGEILAEELAETAVTPTELARQLKVPGNRITQIIQGKRAISGDTALRMGHWFGTSQCPLREQGQRRDGEAAVDRGDDSCYDHGRSCADSADAVP
jgi:addiction module HigA family antidote